MAFEKNRGDTLEINRVTIRFKSDGDRDYLYDDQTGSILPWSNLRESILKHKLRGDFTEARPALQESAGADVVESESNTIDRWLKEYGAFVRPWSKSLEEPVPESEALRKLIESSSFELLLILTENCNLRCKYCALSSVYPLNRVRTNEKMSAETAIRAVDWYAELVKPQLAQNPRKRFGLSFYGGDPMMNMTTLEAVLVHVREKHPGAFLPVMTTNGTLLTQKNVKVLVDHDVQLAVSLDGDEEDHDRLRVDSRDRGTHARIMENLRRIKAEHPLYFATKMTTVSVYDWKTDVERAEAFYDDNSKDVPPSVFVNQVAGRNTDYYADFTQQDADGLNSRMDRLRERYKDAKVNGEEVSSYMQALVGMPVALTLLRNRAGDKRPGFLPFTGTCLPGDKIAVHVDGKIDMCERVNGTYPIGHLDDGGIDFERLREVIQLYREQVMSVCHKCPATKHCNVCPALTEGEGSWTKVGSLCAGTVQGAKQRLADYVSVMERNPSADFTFDTDTSYLERRMLFMY